MFPVCDLVPCQYVLVNAIDQRPIEVIELSVWRIHRRIGMSGGLLVNALSRETDRRLTEDEATQVQQWHAEAYLNQIEQVRAGT